ncbi:uncharacterized protein PG998_011415 [Apiospora kogelbergensis]|uniref:uncharacterized protein n=1 Tax=Apiospora kogelbergensis TaxID=1337665 RepID=UPI003130D931
MFDGFQLARSAQGAFNPNSLPVETRLSWCKDQMNSCVELCAGPGLGANSCDHMTLNYACTCANNTAPGLVYYTRTMPTFICEEIRKGCADGTEGDAAEKKECDDSKKSTCGTLDPMSANKQVDSKASSTTATTNTDIATSTPEATNPSSPPEGNEKPHVALLAAVVAGILVFVGSLAGCFYWLGKRHSARKKRKSLMINTDEDDKVRPYKVLQDDQCSSPWSAHEICTGKEIPVEMDSAPSPIMMEDLRSPGPNANHFVAELDGRMMPSVASKPATTYNRDDAQKYQMPKEEL